MANEPLAMTLDVAIAQLSAHSDLDGRGEKILAAVKALRDSRGRDRNDALRLMCGDWGVKRQEKIDGTWKNRSMPALEAALGNSLCLAAAQWQPEPHEVEPSEQDVAKRRRAPSSATAAATPQPNPTLATERSGAAPRARGLPTQHPVAVAASSAAASATHQRGGNQRLRGCANRPPMAAKRSAARASGEPTESIAFVPATKKQVQEFFKLKQTLPASSAA